MRWIITTAMAIAALNGGCKRAPPVAHDGHAPEESPSTQTDPHDVPPAVGNEHTGHGGAHASASPQHPVAVAGDASDHVHGYAAFMVDRARATALGMATSVVAERDIHKALRTSGVITLDETRSAHVHPKVRGFIEKITANFVGQKVSAGQSLCTV